MFRARLLVAAALAIASQVSLAGGFVTLPTNFAPGTGSKAGSQDQDSDQLYLLRGSVASTDPDGTLHYNLPATLTQLAERTTNIVVGGESVGTFFDFVFQDVTTHTLVFGSKIELNPGDFEINDIFRTGYTGFTAAAAWTRLTSADLRAYLVTRTARGLKQGALTYDPSSVAFRSDINDSEGNPWSGLYLIRTNATAFKDLAGAVRVRQGGEEGQQPLDYSFLGYAPTTAPVPEPSTYMLLLAGVGFAVFQVKRMRAAG